MTKTLEFLIKARDEASGVFQKVTGANKGLSDSIVNAAPVIGAAAGAYIGLVKTAGELGQAWMDNTIQVADWADKIGTSTEEASGLKEMADDVGVSMGTMEVALKAMSKQGLEPSIEGLIEVKSRLDQAKDPADKLALAQKLLGRSGADLIPIFNKFSNEEMRDYISNMKAGQLVTAEEARRARELRDAIDDTTDSYESAKMELGGFIVQESDATGHLERLNAVLSGQISYWDAFADNLGIVTPHMAEVNAQAQRTKVLDAESKRWQGLANYYIGIDDAASDAGEAISATSEKEAIAKAAAAVLAGDHALAESYLEQAKVLHDYNNDLQNMIDHLTAVTEQRWEIKVGYIAPIQRHESGAGPFQGGYQHGGAFEVRGPAGIDNVPVAFRASAGEKVSVTPAGGEDALAGEVRAMRSDIRRMTRSLPIILRDAVEQSR